MLSYFEYVNLPKIPLDVIESVKIIENKKPISFGKHLHEPDDPSKRNRWPVEMDINLSLWIKTNIFPNEKIYMAYSVSTVNFTLHRDIRRFCYMYVLQNGGDELFSYGGSSIENIVKIKCDLHRWIKLNTGMLHGIIGPMTEKRISIQVTTLSAYSHLNEKELEKLYVDFPDLKFI